MKRLLTAALSLCMTTALCGCMCETAETMITPDGSGSMTVTFGISEKLVEALELQDEMAAEDFEPFTYAGRTYYGDSATEEFSDVAEFNAVFKRAADAMKKQDAAINMGEVTLSQNTEGALTLTIVCDENTGSRETVQASLAEEKPELSDADVSAAAGDLVMLYAFTFPKEIRQISGDSRGVSISGNEMSVDLLLLSPGMYQFTTSAWTIPTVAPSDIPQSGVALARTQQIDVDGTRVTFKTYALVDEKGGETNFVKLRDVAYVMNGTVARFDVDWDGSVVIVPMSAYEANGSEMTTPFAGDRAYTKATAPTKIYDQSVPLGAITLTDDNGGGYTYYKLRDLGQVLDFDVSWSAERGIYIDSGKPYTAD